MFLISGVLESKATNANVSILFEMHLYIMLLTYYGTASNNELFYFQPVRLRYIRNVMRNSLENVLGRDENRKVQ
jgi:hypothetical protein